MNTPIITKEKIQVDLADEVMSFTLRSGIAICALVGVWGISCLVSAMVTAGPMAVLRGYIAAITGL